MLLISSCMFGIWYLFLNMSLLKSFESNANLILPSFFLVITIGLIKQSSSHLLNFTICPSFSILYNSFLTLSSKCRGTLLPLVWIGLNGEWKWVIFLSNGFFPTLLNNPLYLWYRLKLVSEWLFNLHKSGSDTLLTGSKGCRWAISIAVCGKLSFPKIFLSCTEVIKHGVLSAFHWIVFWLQLSRWS